MQPQISKTNSETPIPAESPCTYIGLVEVDEDSEETQAALGLVDEACRRCVTTSLRPVTVFEAAKAVLRHLLL